MKRDGKFLLWSCSVLTVALTAQAISDGSNPYERIVDRNVFSLKPPAPPPSNEPPPVLAPKIELQGITSILGRRQVLFKAKIADKDQSFVLSEGQRDGEIEVLEIDEAAGSVKFNNHGAAQTLYMDKDAVKAPSTLAAAPAATGRPVPAAAGRPGGTRGGGDSGATSGGGQQQGLRSIPTRPTRGSTSASGGVNSGGGIVSGGTIGNTTAQPSQPALSSEEQTIMIEVERERTKAHVDAGELPPLPPTELTPPGSTGIPDDAIPPPLPQ